MADPKNSLGDDLQDALNDGAEPEEENTAVNDGEVEETEPSGEVPTDDSPTDDAPETEGEGQPWYSQLEEMGFEGLDSEEAARERLIEAYRDRESQLSQAQEQTQRLSQYAKYGEEFLRLQSDKEFQEFLKSRQQPAQESQQSQDPWWSPPEYNVEQATKYWKPKFDAQGQPVVSPSGTVTYGWAEDTPAEVRAQAEAYNAYIDGWAEKLAKRPHEALPPVVTRSLVEAIRGGDKDVLAALDEYVESRWSQKSQAQQEDQFFDSIRKQDWVYAKDPKSGTPKTDMMGNLVYSEEFKKHLAHVEKAEQMGIGSLQDQWSYATAQVELESLRTRTGNAEATETAQETREQKKRQHTRRVAGKKQTTGDVPEETSKTMGETFLEELERQGAMA